MVTPEKMNWPPASAVVVLAVPPLRERAMDLDASGVEPSSEKTFPVMVVEANVQFVLLPLSVQPEEQSSARPPAALLSWTSRYVSVREPLSPSTIKRAPEPACVERM